MLVFMIVVEVHWFCYCCPISPLCLNFLICLVKEFKCNLNSVHPRSSGSSPRVLLGCGLGVDWRQELADPLSCLFFVMLSAPLTPRTGARVPTGPLACVAGGCRWSPACSASFPALTALSPGQGSLCSPVFLKEVTLAQIGTYLLSFDVTHTVSRVLVDSSCSSKKTNPLRPVWIC